MHTLSNINHDSRSVVFHRHSCSEQRHAGAKADVSRERALNAAGFTFVRRDTTARRCTLLVERGDVVCVWRPAPVTAALMVQPWAANHAACAHPVGAGLDRGGQHVRLDRPLLKARPSDPVRIGSVVRRSRKPCGGDASWSSRCCVPSGRVAEFTAGSPRALCCRVSSTADCEQVGRQWGHMCAAKEAVLPLGDAC